MADQGSRQARRRRLDRTSLQPTQTSFGPRYDEPGRLRRPIQSDGTSRLTVCPPNGVKPNVDDSGVSGHPVRRYADDAVVHCVTERQARTLVAAIGQTGWSRSGCDCIPTRRKWCTAKTATADSTTCSRRLRSWGSPFVPVPCARSANDVRRVPAGDQQGRPEQDQRSDPPMAAAPLDRAEPRRDRPTDQPCRAGMDDTYGAFYRSDDSPPVAHQRLRDALDPSTNGCAPPRKPRHTGSASHANIPGSSPIGHGCTVPGGQDDKSPVTRDNHAGICGNRRVKPPPATRQRSSL